MEKKFDIKSIIIAILLVVIFFGAFKIRSNEMEFRDFNELELENDKIKSINDRLIIENGLLDIRINAINLKIDSTTSLLKKNELELTKLKKRKNEIPKYVSTLSADDVASSLSEFIEKTKN